MALKEISDYIGKEAAKTKASFSSKKDSLRDYLMDYELKKYFGKDISEEEKQRMKESLEKKLDSGFEKYNKELDGIVRKTASKGTMGLAILNDLYAYVSNVPIMNVTGFGYALFALKTAAEAPALYKYLMKSHDWYGAGEHLLLKPVRYLIPALGAALESGAFERMVRKRIIKEAKAEFITEEGEYQKFEERMKEKLKQPIYTAIEKQEKKKAA